MTVHETGLFSPLADYDLEEIGDFIAKDNPARALSFIRELREKCTRLAFPSAIGAPRPELGEGIRMLPHGRYLIFYREDNSSVRIERVMHGARDIGSEEFEMNS